MLEIKPSLAVMSTTAEKQQTAQMLANELALDYIPQDTIHKYDYVLVFTPNYLGLQKTSESKFAPFYIDFIGGKIQYRSQAANLRNELLARAMGQTPATHPRIVDVTAGLGRDSFILATLGFEITLLERSPIIYALLRDALNRARMIEAFAPIIARMQLIQSDAIHWLAQQTLFDRPDVIYLDPMFPIRKKSASVKKEMVILQELLGKDEDSETLFRQALACAGKRVVVKRPRLAVNITETDKPNFSLTGKSSRFDIYLAKKME